MDDELNAIKKKKLEELKNRYLSGEKKMEQMPNTPIEMTDADINNKIKQYDTVVVDCWAPWCGPCRAIAPIVEDLAKELQGKVVFGKLNVDNNQSTAMDYGIMSIPSLLIFKNGKLVDKIVGAMPKQMLMAKLALHI
ncbi:MAG: thioredoxin [Candidatus Thermoplasmatota archaeon]|jgi:thioredoxin 1|nr:thioredoxin [Candidatus Thermoplasmatota archaeon]